MFTPFFESQRQVFPNIMAKEVKKQSKKPQQIKILFLDVDGVINTTENQNLCPKMIKRLGHIIHETKCKVCLSTSWRTNESQKAKLFKELKMKGNIEIDKIYVGDTPTIYDKPRAYEIKAFLDSICEDLYTVIKWVAIDDMQLDKPQFESRKLILTECESLMRNHFVLTDDQIGLTHDNAKDVIKLLQ